MAKATDDMGLDQRRFEELERELGSTSFAPAPLTAEDEQAARRAQRRLRRRRLGGFLTVGFAVAVAAASAGLWTFSQERTAERAASPPTPRASERPAAAPAALPARVADLGPAPMRPVAPSAAAPEADKVQTRVDAGEPAGQPERAARFQLQLNENDPARGQTTAPGPETIRRIPLAPTRAEAVIDAPRSIGAQPTGGAAQTPPGAAPSPPGDPITLARAPLPPARPAEIAETAPATAASIPPAAQPASTNAEAGVRETAVVMPTPPQPAPRPAEAP